MFSSGRRLGLLLTQRIATLSVRFNSTLKDAAFTNLLASLNSTNNKSVPDSVTSTLEQSSFLNRTQSKDIINKPPRASQKGIADSLKVTGPLAGRIVGVHKGDVNSAYRSLKFIINSNNIRGEAMQQRFHMKPGKKLEMKRIRRKKKLFNEGIRRLMDLVKEAKRRGY